MKLDAIAFAAINLMMGVALADPINVSVAPSMPLIEQG
jgi:hypothetical protein